jgi:heptosyltransferase-2
VEDYRRILVRATNWVGDAVMSLPALAALRRRFPRAHIAVLARGWVAGLYRRESFADEIIAYEPARGLAGWRARLATANLLRKKNFDCALLLQNAFDAALIARLAGIPRRIGYNRDARGWLLTDAVAVPAPGEIPPHESFYYLELLRRVGWVDRLPERELVRLESRGAAREAGQARLAALGISAPVVGVSPGAAYGNAKRWFPERFALAAAEVAGRIKGEVVLFGSGGEHPLCEQVAEGLRWLGAGVRNLAGETSLEEFVDLAAACRVFLTNDSGSMHIASALDVPTVAIFGATNHVTTGPTGPLARVLRKDVDCSPCLLRECPIDHRCMTAVEAPWVAQTALELLQVEDSGYAREDPRTG